MHHTLVSYIVYLYEWMGAEIDTFTHPNFSKFGDQAAALAHALSAEVTPRRLLRWNALSEGPGCPTVSENSSSNPSFKPGSMLVRSKPVIIFMYIYVCVWNICFMNYKYHLRFLGSTSSDRQDTQVPLVACFTITYRIQQQMDHRATPAAPDLRKAWAKKGTRHRAPKRWGVGVETQWFSTSLPCPWASQDSSCDICLRCEMHICDDRCCCVFPNISRNLSQIFGWTIQTPSIGPLGAFSEKPQVALLRHPSLERHRTTKSSVICAVATHCAWCLWHGFLVIPNRWSPTNLKFRRSKELQVFWDSQVLQLKSSKQSLRSSGSAMVTKFPEKLNWNRWMKFRPGQKKCRIGWIGWI